MLPRRFLHVVQLLLLLLQLRTHPLRFLLLLLLALVPLHAPRNAIAVREMNRVIELVKIFLERVDRFLLSLDLRLPRVPRHLSPDEGPDEDEEEDDN